MQSLVSYTNDADELQLSFYGNLDISVSQGVCELCRRPLAGLRSCTVDLSQVERIFDSGVALLLMLYRRLVALGADVVVLTDDPRLTALLPVCRSPSGVAASSLG